VNYLGDDYRIDELVSEVGRLLLFLLAGASWTFLILMLVVD
jgi:hypothetical protein